LLRVRAALGRYVKALNAIVNARALWTAVRTRCTLAIVRCIATFVSLSMAILKGLAIATVKLVIHHNVPCPGCSGVSHRLAAGLRGGIPGHTY
jgi:hypothetical protein